MHLQRIAGFFFLVAAFMGPTAPAFASHAETHKALQQGNTQTSDLARTGTAVLRWSPLGGGLLAVGYMLVLVNRPRRQDQKALAGRRV